MKISNEESNSDKFGIVKLINEQWSKIKDNRSMEDIKNKILNIFREEENKDDS